MNYERFAKDVLKVPQATDTDIQRQISISATIDIVSALANPFGDTEANMAEIEKEPVVAVLNKILESELAGVVRYTHYSFLVFGFGRIPIVSWLRGQADESLLHAQQAGEWITSLGAYPSLEIGPLLDSHTLDLGSILQESMHAENVALDLYRDLLA